MNEKELKDIIKRIDGGESNVKVPYEPMDDYINLFNSIGEADEDWETNGWQVDFWIGFKVDGKEYMISGSWFYGHYSMSLR
jgi:hypothetical protein